MEFLCGLFISVYFSVFKFVDCVVVCGSSFVVCLFLFISLCLSLWTVWWFVGVPLWSVYYFYFSVFKFVDCMVVCSSSFVVFLFSVYFSVFKFVDCVVVCGSSFVVCLLFLFLCV